MPAIETRKPFASNDSLKSSIFLDGAGCFLRAFRAPHPDPYSLKRRTWIRNSATLFQTMPWSTERLDANERDLATFISGVEANLPGLNSELCNANVPARHNLRAPQALNSLQSLRFSAKRDFAWHPWIPCPSKSPRVRKPNYSTITASTTP